MTTTVVTFHNVPTDELQVDDVVLTHSLRVLLDVPADVIPASDSLPECFTWVGLVQNVEEVRASGAVPMYWLYEGPAGQRYTEPRWNVQGNHSARWTVERTMEAPHGVHVGSKIDARDVTIGCVRHGVVRMILAAGSHDFRALLDTEESAFPVWVHI